MSEAVETSYHESVEGFVAAKKNAGHHEEYDTIWCWNSQYGAEAGNSDVSTAFSRNEVAEVMRVTCGYRYVTPLCNASRHD